MAIIDLIILVPIIFGAIKGYRRGFLMELVTIGAFLIAIVLGFQFLGLGSEILAKIFGQNNLFKISPYLSFLVIFFPSLWIIKLGGKIMRNTLRQSFFGTFDGYLGAALGGLVSLFTISIFIYFLDKLHIELPQKWMNEAMFYDFTKDFAPQIIEKILPASNQWVQILKNKLI